MKRAALLCPLLFLEAVCAAQTAGTGSISGVVRDAATGAPVTQAGVSLTLPDGKSATTDVDAQGRYTLSGIPAGTYSVTASVPPEKGQAQTPQQAKQVIVPSGGTLTAVDFRLPFTGTISGRILDENDEPVSSADVFLVAKRYDHGALQYPLAGVSTRSDDSGIYRLAGVPAGESLLVETRVPRREATGDLPVNTLYPNVLSPDLAAEIVLSPGETRNGVDIHRAKLPAFCVEGTVDGAPETGLNLEILDEMVVNGPRSRQSEAAGRTKPDGAFRVCGVHRGEYLFMASGSSPDADQFPFFASGTVAVTNGDVRDVKLLHSSMSSFSAEFVWDGDASAQLPVLHGMLDLEGKGAGFNLAFTVPGSFSRMIPLHPDNYKIDVLRGINGPGQYVKDITCGGQSVLHGAAPLGGAMSCGTVRLVIAHDGGALTTRVEDSDGRPVSGAYVAIVPESAATEAEMSAVMTVGQTDANGVYPAMALAPGKYRVLATNETVDLAANRVDKLWAAQSHGQEVEIGANANVQLKVELR